MIQINNLCVCFEEKVVLDNFSLTIPKQGVTALSGPSGCGKTTLLRCIAGLHTPDRGEILGTVPGQTAILFQENRLLPWRTVREHITDVLPTHRRGNEVEYLQLVELEQEANAFPAQLSGGMARRLAFARCMALGGELFLLDEPFTGMDLPRIRRLMTHLAQLPVPVIISSHEPEVLALADRVIPLSGPPLSLL